MKKEKQTLTIPSMFGTDGEASIALTNATFEVKPDGTRRQPDEEFGPWLIEEIYTRRQLMTEQKGFFKKKIVCPACKTDLDPAGKRFQSIEYELQYKGFAPFGVRITIPVVECSQCKKISGLDPDGSLSFHLTDAILHAFDSENVKA